MFIDRVKIFVRAGNGGDGCLSFRREKFVPRGGPDGGNGGKGGDVIIEVDENISNLLRLSYNPHQRAESGKHGKGKNRHGRNGKNRIIKVPQGTLIYEEKKLLCDLTNNGERFIVARGGRGGRGNAVFATSTNQSPRRREEGGKGEEKTLILELKLIADVGFVGYPNAGKSTLLSRISTASPKIAQYPFTTLSPNLGVVERDGKRVKFADIPGIIDGAHNGRGLGLEFLRHIERTRILLFILDATKNPEEQYNSLKDELSSYNPILLKKPRCIAINKIDLINQEIIFPIKAIHLISALYGDGVEDLLEDIFTKIGSSL
jgi:GTP-binding protein